jgi:hypothetical protein
MCCQVMWVRSIARSVIEYKAMCTRSHVTAHGARREAMAARAMQDMRLMWHALNHGSCARAQCALAL